MENEAYDWAEIVAPLLDWYGAEARNLPWRRDTEPYHVWVSEIMLQQTRVDTVIPYYERFLRALPDVRSLADTEEAALLKLWEGLGYYSRVRSMQKAARQICGNDGRFPDTFEALCALPGIGDYTAGAILSIAFGKPIPAVDGNVARVASRLTGTTAEASDPTFRACIKEKLKTVYPLGRCGDFTQSLMDLGATVCLPNGVPHCAACPLKGLCCAYRDGTQAFFPAKKAKKDHPVQDRTVFLLTCGECIALRKRPEGGLLGGLWELPGTDGMLNEQAATEWLDALGAEATSLRSLPKVRHIFTHLEWLMTIYAAECKRTEGESLVWATWEALSKEYALPTAFRKVTRLRQPSECAKPAIRHAPSP